MIYESIRYDEGGIAISKRAPKPGTPVSRIEIPVMERISRDRYRPKPVFLKYSRLKICSLTPALER